jgi:hypothetical protein
MVRVFSQRAWRNKKRPAQRAATFLDLRVFKPFLWLEAGSVKMAVFRLSHQRVTLTVRRLSRKTN